MIMNRTLLDDVLPGEKLPSNELEEYIFEDWSLHSDENFPPDREKIEEHLKASDINSKRKEKMLLQLRETRPGRLFELFTVADAY